MGWPEWSAVDIISERPDVRVNQLGYLLGRPKQATLVSDAEDRSTSRFATGTASPSTPDFPNLGRFGRNPRPA
jgi:hypothetical protein